MPMWNGLMVCLWTILSCRHHCSARQSQVSSLICRKCSILVLNRCCITVCFWVLVSYLEGWVVGWKNLAIASYLRCRCNVSCLWTAGTIFDRTEPWDQRTRKPSPDSTASDYHQTSDSENRTTRVNHLCIDHAHEQAKTKFLRRNLSFHNTHELAAPPKYEVWSLSQGNSKSSHSDNYSNQTQYNMFQNVNRIIWSEVQPIPILTIQALNIFIGSTYSTA